MLIGVNLDCAGGDYSMGRGPGRDPALVAPTLVKLVAEKGRDKADLLAQSILKDTDKHKRKITDYELLHTLRVFGFRGLFSVPRG